MRRDARVDANQQEIVDALRQIGASIQYLHHVGEGCPDLLVGFRGKDFLLELKTVKGKLNPTQRKWHQHWRGQVAVVRTVSDALAVIGVV